MQSTRKSVGLADTRELSDRELNEMARGAGDIVRAQTIEQRKRLMEDLRKELALARTAFSLITKEDQ